jgi:outer membrane autotransporter protein
MKYNMRLKNACGVLAACAAGIALAVAPRAQAVSTIPVDLELALLMDVSGSVDDIEYQLQRSGYANAFRNTNVQAAITGGRIGSIAISAIQFDQSTYSAIGWTQLSSIADVIAFADALDVMDRLGSGSTGVGQGIVFATNEITTNTYDGTRLVIDVSGDGENNTGIDADVARDQALTAGVTTINGISIGDTTGSLRQWYEDNVIGGSDAFARDAATFADFEAEILEKLLAEIRGTTMSLPILSTLHNATLAATRTATGQVNSRLVGIRNGVPAATTQVQAAPVQDAKSGLSAKSPAIATESAPRLWEVYGTLFYIEQDTDEQARTDANGARMLLFPGTDTEIIGGTVGIDRRLTDEWLVGLAFTAANSDVDVRNFSSTDIDSYYISPYVSYFRPNVMLGADYYADAIYAYGNQDYDIKRSTGAGHAKGSPDGETHSIELNTGLKFENAGIKHGPFVGFRWITGDIDGYDESGPGAISVSGTDFDSVASILGYEVAKPFAIGSGTLLPYLNAAWEHEFEDDTVRVGGTPLSIVDEDTFVLGIGVAAQFINGWTVQTEYQGRFGSDVSQHYAGLRLGYQF